MRIKAVAYKSSRWEISAVNKNTYNFNRFVCARTHARNRVCVRAFVCARFPFLEKPVLHEIEAMRYINNVDFTYKLSDVTVSIKWFLDFVHWIPYNVIGCVFFMFIVHYATLILK